MTPRRVLLVDDDPDVVEMLALALQAFGLEVVGAHSGEAALELVERGGFSSVVLDVRLSGRDGISVASELRDRWPGVAVVFLTGFDEAQLPAAAALGCRVLRKPPDLHALAALIG